MNNLEHDKDKDAEKKDAIKEKGDVSAQEGSRSDPQLTELDGLKQGGVEPHVNPEDKPRDAEGKPD